MIPRSSTTQRVLVTGGAAGIGRAIVERFGTAGARVAVGDADEGALSRLRADLPDFLTLPLDVADAAACARFVAEAAAAMGGVDVLVNNAGIAGARAPLVDLDAADWRRSFAVNVDGPFFLMKAVVPVMRRLGGGTVINISTSSTFTLPAARADYICSKWALEGLTRAAARELGPDKIRVNAIRPGLVDSDRMQSIIRATAEADGVTVAETERAFLKFVSMRSKVAAAEIGDVAVFLASEAGRHITGQLLGVDAGAEWEA